VTVWVTLHSGSRGVGNRIGTHYIKFAQELCRKTGIDLPDRDLAFLPEDHPSFRAYMRDLNWAAETRNHREPVNSREVHGPAPKATVADVAAVPRQLPQPSDGRGLSLPASLCVRNH
jgi:hypothetical protein